MFPEQTHVKILRRIDDLEADAYRTYRALARLRLELQTQWRALPSGQTWTQAAQDKSDYEGRAK